MHPTELNTGTDDDLEAAAGSSESVSDFESTTNKKQANTKQEVAPTYFSSLLTGVINKATHKGHTTDERDEGRILKILGGGGGWLGK